MGWFCFVEGSELISVVSPRGVGPKNSLGKLKCQRFGSAFSSALAGPSSRSPALIFLLHRCLSSSEAPIVPHCCSMGQKQPAEQVGKGNYATQNPLGLSSSRSSEYCPCFFSQQKWTNKPGQKYFAKKEPQQYLGKPNSPWQNSKMKSLTILTLISSLIKAKFCGNLLWDQLCIISTYTKHYQFKNPDQKSALGLKNKQLQNKNYL